jgi:hypothetical protein
VQFRQNCSTLLTLLGESDVFYGHNFLVINVILSLPRQKREVVEIIVDIFS